MLCSHAPHFFVVRGGNYALTKEANNSLQNNDPLLLSFSECSQPKQPKSKSTSMSSKTEATASPLKLATLVVLWYAGNTFYNVYNKTALNMLEAHWFVASAQLAVGVVLSAVMWLSGIRKMPNLTSSDLMKCLPIGLFASLAHCGTVLASAVGAVSFAQIVKACEPVFAAVVGLLIPPMDVKPVLAYLMLIPIVGGVGIACIKEGKGVEINVAAFLFASMANAAASLKGKLGSSVTKSLKADPAKNMDAANVYAVMNIISFCFTIPFVVFTGELSTLSQTWDAAVLTVEGGSTEIAKNIIISGLFFYFYNETAFAFTSHVGAVTSSVLNTAKRVIIIVVSAVVFQEAMERNTVIGSAIAICGTFAYSLAAAKKPSAAPKAKTKAA